MWSPLSNASLYVHVVRVQLVAQGDLTLPRPVAGSVRLSMLGCRPSSPGVRSPRHSTQLALSSLAEITQAHRRELGNAFRLDGTIHAPVPRHRVSLGVPFSRLADPHVRRRAIWGLRREDALWPTNMDMT